MARFRKVFKSISQRTRCNNQHSYSSCKRNKHCRQKGTKGSLCMQLQQCCRWYWFQSTFHYSQYFISVRRNLKSSPFMIKCMIYSYSNYYQCIWEVKFKILLFIPNRRQFLFICEHWKELSEMEIKGKQELLVFPNVICSVWSFRDHPITVITYPVTEI